MNYPNRNYQKELDKIILQMTQRKKLLLHSCCAPCSSYCLEYLSQYFDVTVFYYNPNIMQEEEYRKRVAEQKRLIDAYNQLEEQVVTNGTETERFILRKISFTEGNYDVARYLETIKGLEDAPEGGSRCGRCFELRLRETARVAKEMGMDYFTTTLSISPHKNAEKLNEIGSETAEKYGLKYLFSDFKKKGGYQRSIVLSKEHGLYRQDFCGCVFSKREAAEREAQSSSEK